MKWYQPIGYIITSPIWIAIGVALGIAYLLWAFGKCIVTIVLFIIGLCDGNIKSEVEEIKSIWTEWNIKDLID